MKVRALRKFRFILWHPLTSFPREGASKLNSYIQWSIRLIQQSFLFSYFFFSYLSFNFIIPSLIKRNDSLVIARISCHLGLVVLFRNIWTTATTFLNCATKVEGASTLSLYLLHSIFYRVNKKARTSYWWNIESNESNWISNYNSFVEVYTIKDRAFLLHRECLAIHMIGRRHWWIAQNLEGRSDPLRKSFDFVLFLTFGRAPPCDTWSNNESQKYCRNINAN